MYYGNFPRKTIPYSVQTARLIPTTVEDEIQYLRVFFDFTEEKEPTKTECGKVVFHCADIGLNESDFDSIVLEFNNCGNKLKLTEIAVMDLDENGVKVNYIIFDVEINKISNRNYVRLWLVNNDETSVLIAKGVIIVAE